MPYRGGLYADPGQMMVDCLRLVMMDIQHWMKCVNSYNCNSMDSAIRMYMNLEKQSHNST